MNDNEILAAKTDELHDGEMKELVVGETKIILAKFNQEYYAVNGLCPHYKAPLIKGALCGKRLYCPWHHSSFDITNGNLCDPPAIDGLTHFATRVENDQVFINLTPLQTEIKKESLLNTKTFIIAGGGAAGLMAAETLRSNGFGGHLVMITRENTLPYDRTALSKKVMSGKSNVEDTVLRKRDFFEKNNIEVEENKVVKTIDAESKTILFNDNRSMQYDALLVATGGEPNKLTIEGSDLENVFVLRTMADAKKILDTAKIVKKASLIGASFIAMEVAASLKTLGLDVIVFSKEEIPFEKNFGKEIGTMFNNMHKEKGVVIKTNVEVEKIEGNGKAEAVVLKNGERIETDLIIVGIGVHPVTDFLQGVQKDEKDKSIFVDEYLQAADGLFVAGDIARFKDARTNKGIRIEHWRVAQQQGRLAAMNMLGKPHSVSEIVPFFWTNQFNKRLSYVGHAKEWDDIVVDGDIAAQNFLAYYLKDDKVLAVASMNRDIESDKIEDVMRKNSLLSVDELKQKTKSD